MATITSVGSGAWSSTDTWDSGVPADGDTVVIASGHTVTFDVDQSAFTGLAKITITGTLKLSRTAGTYYLKLAPGTVIDGAGTFDCGTSGDAIPFTAKHTVNVQNGSINGTMTFTAYGTSPTYVFARLSRAENAGATRLEIDTDVTGDLWTVGDAVCIVNINKGRNVENRVISAIDASYIDISTGLSAGKNAGSYVVLAARHLNFIGTATIVAAAGSANLTGSRFYNAAGSRCIRVTGVYEKLLFHTPNMCVDKSNCKFTDCVFLNCVSGAREASANYYKGCYGFGNSKVIEDRNIVHVYNCLFAGNAYVLYSSYGDVVNTVFIGNDKGLSFSHGTTLNSCSFSNENTNAYQSQITAFNTVFDGTNELTNFSTTNNKLSISYDHDGNSGALKAWTLGGTVTSQTTIKPTGYDVAYLHALTSASYENYWLINFLVPAGLKINIDVNLYKDASMTYLPRAYLMANQDDPIQGDTPVDSFTMTDSTDIWEDDTFTIDNSAVTVDKFYALWFVAKNASGNAYSAYKITTEGGTGGAVRILPFTGKVGL